MPDFADIGSDYTERWLEAQISEHQYQLNHAVNAFEIGRCRNCDDKTDDGRTFCDLECRKDFEDRQKAIKRRGRLTE
jgi:hypothetical protein